MKMDNGTHSTKRKSGGFISNTFIISKNDSPQKKMGKVLAIISLILIVAAVVLGVMIISNYVNRQQPAQTSSVVSNEEVVTSSGDENVSSTQDEFDENGILMDLSESYKMNDETIGHVYIPDTKLDYIVAKRKDNKDGLGNLYYLNHKLDGTKNPYGTPFADYRALFVNGYQSTNVTIYGHNSKAGEYFETVKSYKNIDFFKEHPILNFDTIYGKAQYKILGVFTECVDYSTPFFEYHNYLEFPINEKNAEQNKAAEEVFNTFTTEFGKRSYYDSGVDVKFGDSFVTLSTCNDEIMGASDTIYRDVLVARRVRPGEKAEVDVSKIEKNLDVVMPEGWIKKFGKENPYK